MRCFSGFTDVLHNHIDGLLRELPGVTIALLVCYERDDRFRLPISITINIEEQ